MSATSLTDNHGDRGMLKVMAMVLFSLFLLALFIGSMARLIGTERDDAASDPVMRNALISRIEPVGAVRTSADELPHGEGIQVAAGGAARSGEELVQGVCAGCHANAVAGSVGAPALGDADAWAARRDELGLDGLVASVIDGKGTMPARGGSDYSDEEIRRAVQHIALFEGGGEVEGGEVTAAVPAGEGGTMAIIGDDLAATPATGGQDAPSDGAVATADTDETVETAIATDVGAAEKAPEAAEVDLLALIGSGAVPEGLPEHVKGAVDGVCAGCHIAGVAGAPALGDVAAWTPRAEAGLAALTASVIDGKGVMPPRGGSTLTDEEIPVAIQYLMAKQEP